MSNRNNRFTVELLFRWNGLFNRGKFACYLAFLTQTKNAQAFPNQEMALKSALEDLLGTTLAGVAGTVGKVEYLASLRDAASGSYSHWGLTRERRL